MNKRAYRHILLKSPEEIAIMRENGILLAEIFNELSSMVQVGRSTLEIDRYVEEKIRSVGAVPSFKGYGGFPGSACTSINDVIIHGIPKKEDVLREGDIVGIDIGLYRKGFHVDSAKTFPVGSISAEAERLLEDTEKSLDLAIQTLRPQKSLFDIANTIQDFLEKKKYGIIRDFVGHGVGKDLHEAPQVPNYRQMGLSKIRLHPGMVLAIEPMVCTGSTQVEVDAEDGWTVRTKDRGLSAHFEHTVAITPTGVEILTQL